MKKRVLTAIGCVGLLAVLAAAGFGGGKTAEEAREPAPISRQRGNAPRRSRTARPHDAQTMVYFLMVCTTSAGSSQRVISSSSSPRRKP